MSDVGIMVVAQNISEDIKTRYQECICRSKPSCTWEINYLTANDPDKKKPFSKSILLNRGIKALYRKKYKIIIQTDIDLVVPPGIIDKTLEIGRQPKVCFYNRHYRIDPEKLPKFPEEYDKADWNMIMKTFPWENANGCWNGMNPESWMASGGYNEYMIEWGREDDVFRTTAHSYGGIKFINYNKFCLIHINHKQRTKDMRKHNNAMKNKADREGIKNWLT